MLRKRPLSVPVEQFVRDGRRRNMGQWRSVWETVLGEVHQRYKTGRLYKRPDNPD
jgi:hypothetical protein